MEERMCNETFRVLMTTYYFFWSVLTPLQRDILSYFYEYSIIICFHCYSPFSDVS